MKVFRRTRSVRISICICENYKIIRRNLSILKEFLKSWLSFYIHEIQVKYKWYLKKKKENNIESLLFPSLLIFHQYRHKNSQQRGCPSLLSFPNDRYFTFPPLFFQGIHPWRMDSNYQMKKRNCWSIHVPIVRQTWTHRQNGSSFLPSSSLPSEDQPFSFPFSVSCLVAKCEAWNIKMKERQPWYVHVWAVYINTNASRSLGESFSCFCISVSLKNGWEKWFTERKVGVEKRELLKEHRPG